MELAIILIALILSIVLHEAAHGYAANALGDPTARLAGRLTLNPVPHIDAVGSVLLPGILLSLGSPFLFGWAKPVPYNPYNLRNQRWGEALVAAAGPATNIAIALVFSLLVRFSDSFGLNAEFVEAATFIVVINWVLAIINMIPVPPLDGSKVLHALLPFRIAHRIFSPIEQLVYRLGPFALIGILFIFVSFLSSPVTQMVVFFTSFFTNLSPSEVVSILQSFL